MATGFFRGVRERLIVRTSALRRSEKFAVASSAFASPSVREAVPALEFTPIYVMRVTMRLRYPRCTREGRVGGHAVLPVRAGARTVGRVLVDRRALPMDLLRLRTNERILCRAGRELPRVRQAARAQGVAFLRVRHGRTLRKGVGLGSSYGAPALSSGPRQALKRGGRTPSTWRPPRSSA